MVKHASLLIEFYQERIEDNLSLLRYLSRDIGEMNRLREGTGGKWEVEELTRHIIFLETQTIQILREQIEHDRAAIKEHEERRSP